MPHDVPVLGRGQSGRVDVTVVAGRTLKAKTTTVCVIRALIHVWGALPTGRRYIYFVAAQILGGFLALIMESSGPPVARIYIPYI